MSAESLYENAQCAYFTAGVCSSCSLLALSPGKRVNAKEKIVLQALATYGVAPGVIESIRIPKDPWGSRCKVKLSVTGSVEAPTIGIVRSDLSSVDLSRCPLTPTHIQDLLETVKELIKTANLSPYDVKERTGELKNLIIISNHDASQGILRFVLRSTEAIPRIRKGIAALQMRHPWVKVISCNVQPLPAAIVEGPDEEILTQQRTIEVRYGELSLSFLPQSFIQVTHEIAEVLYRRATAFAQTKRFNNVLDLFCGVGGFSLSIAKEVKQVTGVEISSMAVESAQCSAKNLGYTNTSFIAADVEAYLHSESVGSPDLIIVNPPRRGLSEGIRTRLLDLAPTAILYSSCDPGTFARDVAHLSQAYTVSAVIPFDMFAMTNHCEVLGLLERAS